MLGTTANAVACMEELVEKYGPAPQSFLVVRLSGVPDRLHEFADYYAFANWMK